MRFEVPQFIDVEDKLFGPFSFKQFLYLAGGAGLAYTLIRLLPIYIGIPLALPVAGFALALVFYRPNNRPFMEMVQSAINYQLKSRFYLWQQKSENKNTIQQTQKTTETIGTQTTNKSGIKDLSWSLDILDKNT